MNQLLDALITSSAPGYYTPEVFDMDFSDYFLPNDPDTQARLREHASCAAYWYALLAEGVADPQQTLNRVDAFTTQATAIGVIVLKALLDNTAHGDDHEC